MAGTLCKGEKLKFITHCYMIKETHILSGINFSLLIYL